MFLLLGGGALAALATLPLLTAAPNRLISGRPLDGAAVPPASWVVMAAAAGLIAAAAFRRDGRGLRLALFIAAEALLLAALWGAGAAAAAQPAALHVGFGPAAWIVLLIAGLTLAEAARPARPTARLVAALLAVVPVVVLIGGGGLAQLSLFREYAARHQLFAAALVQHGELVAAAFLPTLCLGLPLGLLAHGRDRLQRPLIALLSVIQTVPSIALFGLLMTPLSRLARALPWLGEAGIGGVGMAPAVIALILYALLPVVRNTTAGLDAVPAQSVDAARGLGMTGWQILSRIELPQALPTLLAGIRITLVQTIGLAAVAALIGAGGLGALMFQGLFAGADDLVLLGALPVVLMALAADLLFRLATTAFKERAQ